MKKDTSVNEFNKWGGEMEGEKRDRAAETIDPDDTIIEAAEARRRRRDDSKDGEREKERESERERVMRAERKRDVCF